MAVIDETCGCGGEKRTTNCADCREKESPGYWCDVCSRAISEKRCPMCGLKARRIRPVNQ